MMDTADTRLRDAGREDLYAEVMRLRQRLEESEETLRAIRHGEVDAVIVESEDRPTIMSLGAAEQAFQVIVDQVAHPAALLAPDGRILQTNTLFAALIQRDQASLSDSRIQDIVAPPSAGALESLLEDGARREAENEILIRNAAGQRIPAFFVVRPLRDNPTGPCLLLTDLSAERLRDKIISEEILAQSILEQVADAVVVCDPAGRIVRASATIEKMINGDPRNRLIDRALPLQQAGGASPLLFSEILASPEIRGREVVFVPPGRDPTYLILSTGLLFDKDGAVRGAVLTFTDLTERKRFESALEQADRRKDEFLAILAHELRNPLAPISNGIRLLSSSDVPPPIKDQALGLMDRQVANMVRLVDDLMDVSRITRGKVELKRTRLRLREVVKVAVETSQPLIAQFEHRLAVTLPPDDVWIDGDFTRLSQIFSNLLNNAAKYSEPGKTITVTTDAPAGGVVSLHVTDQGIGIPPEMQDRIFDLFAQADDSLERSHGGLGVGLTLVRNLVEMHGGSVSVSSEGPGFGSAFSVRLPVALAPVAEASSSSPLSGQTDGGLRILIVEDNPALAQTTGWLVEAMGHSYQLAHNGKDAISAAADYVPDVVMLDIGLPGMNGYDVCRALKADPKLADTVFIAQTGWGQSEHKRMAGQAGFSHHLVKPIDYDQLKDILDSMLHTL